MSPVRKFTLALSVCWLLFPWNAGRSDESLAGIACRSVHLAFDAPEGTALYLEATIEQSAVGTYFCVCGFSHGYFGMQELGDGKKLLIFSVWDPGKQDDPRAVKEEQRVKLIAHDPKTRIGRFGGEGTGGQSFFDFDWKIGTTYRFLTTAKLTESRTEYAAWFFHPEEKRWKNLATFSTLARGDLLAGHYSFVEDFRRDKRSATQVRSASFGRGWTRTKAGKWQELIQAKFTADSNPALNINAGVKEKENLFFLTTGGETKNTAALNTALTCQPQGGQPPADVPRPEAEK